MVSSILSEKKTPTPFRGNVEAKVYARLAVWGTISPRPFAMSGANQSHRISFFGEVTASTEKAARQVSNRQLCLVPHTSRFLDSNRWVVELMANNAAVFTFSPTKEG